jgi:hypothetical protein
MEILSNDQVKKACTLGTYVAGLPDGIFPKPKI